MIKLAITMGDPAGIGPEIILKTFLQPPEAPGCASVVIGSVAVLEKAARELNLPVSIVQIKETSSERQEPGVVPVLEPQNLPDLSGIVPGKIQEAAGVAARCFIDKAVALIQEGSAHAMCTAPIHKEAMHKAGFRFPGHTEYLAHLSGTEEFAMLMCGGRLRVVLLTIHTALRCVPDMITRDLVLRKIRLTNRFIPYFGIDRPRIAVCGLNPHAGEGGLFGDEEIRIIEPAIQEAQNEGILVEGPFPADTIYHRMLKGDFDAILAMYHDQALIPVKTLAFSDGVNITMGLPFIRTSVDHGTGFDIAGKGRADPASLEAAIEHAALLAKNKVQYETS